MKATTAAAHIEVVLAVIRRPSGRGIRFGSGLKRGSDMFPYLGRFAPDNAVHWTEFPQGACAAASSAWRRTLPTQRLLGLLTPGHHPSWMRRAAGCGGYAWFVYGSSRHGFAATLEDAKAAWKSAYQAIK
jgi:hypothetical protein